MPIALTYVIVPTFREPAQIARLVSSFSSVRHEELRILIANGNPGDETSRYLARAADSRVIELAGHSGLFWSGLINLGLRHVLQDSDGAEFVILMNADVVWDGDVITALIAKARQTPRAQLAAVTVGDQRVVSSGVRVLSWSLTLNRHPLAGSSPDDLPADALVPVDFLPTRCTLIPFSAVVRAGLVAEWELPHYGADNEYTNRVRKLGFPAYIFTGARVRVETKNTGLDVFHRRLSFRQRISSLFNIKSTANPIYRLRFIRLAYPWWAWPTAMALYLVRSLAESLLGGGVIRSVIHRAESGYSGS